MPASGVRTAPRQDLIRLDAVSATRLVASDGATEQLVAVMHGPWGYRRLVFLKRLVLQGGTINEPAARALATEAGVLCRISHPAVASLHDFRRIQGRLTLVLERVDGLTLARLLGDPAQAPPLPPEARLFLVHRLFDALAALHEAVDPRTGVRSPIVHGGVGLRSLLVPRDGYAKVVDFGCASLAPSSPEAWRGATASPASDVHAACGIARQLLPAPRTSSAPLDEAIRAGLSRPGARGVPSARFIADLARASVVSDFGRTALSDVVGAIQPRRRDSLCDDDITVRAPCAMEQDDTPTTVLVRPLEVRRSAP